MTVRHAIAALATLPLLVSLAPGETVKIGPAELTVPPGWQVKSSKPKLLVLARPGDPDHAGNLLVVVGNAPAATIDQNFADFANGVTGKHFEAKYVAKARTAEGLLTRKTFAVNRQEAKGRSVTLRTTAVGVQGKTQFVGIALITSTSEAKDANEPTLLATLNSLKMTDAPAVQVPGKTVQDVAGLYVRFGLTNTINPMGGLTLEQTRDYLLFLPGGFVYRDLPPVEQIERPDADALRRAKPKSCGTYACDGKTLTVTHTDDGFFFTDDTAPFKNDPDAIEADGAYARIAPQKNKRLNATFRSFHYSGGDGSTGVTGGVASEHFLTLRPDGTYEQQGMTSLAMTVESGGGRTGIAGNSKKKAPARGTYTLDGYTLTLNPAGGKPQAMTAYLPEGDAMIVIDDTAYLNEKRRK